ncbi:MAG: hypothetical protein QW524_03030 [Candidatus Woesearchaeota archaeon]
MLNKVGDVSGMFFQVILIVLTVIAIGFILLPLIFPLVRVVFNFDSKDAEAKELLEFLVYTINKVFEKESSMTVVVPYSNLKSYNIRIRELEGQNRIYLSKGRTGIQVRLLYKNYNYHPYDTLIDLTCVKSCYLNITFDGKNVNISKGELVN